MKARFLINATVTWKPGEKMQFIEHKEQTLADVREYLQPMLKTRVLNEIYIKDLQTGKVIYSCMKLDGVYRWSTH